jgi:predicted metal-dependent phosphoesterase TrpH
LTGVGAERAAGFASAGTDERTERGAVVADLHLHTTCSDGRLAPAAVVAQAAAQGLVAVAVCDHDVVTGIAEAREAGTRLGVEVIAGVELTARWRGRTCHVLGYHVDPTASALVEALAGARRATEASVAAALAALQARGYAITAADLARYRARYPTPTTLLLAMVRQRQLRTRADVQTLLGLLRATGPAWTAEDAIGLVHAAGGVAVLAHPGRRASAQRAPRIPLDATALRDLTTAGLDGVEVIHPSHGVAEQARYADLAGALGLVATGGSDWHGRAAERPIGSHGLTAGAWPGVRAALRTARTA